MKYNEKLAALQRPMTEPETELSCTIVGGETSPAAVFKMFAKGQPLPSHVGAEYDPEFKEVHNAGFVEQIYQENQNRLEWLEAQAQLQQQAASEPEPAPSPAPEPAASGGAETPQNASQAS